MSKEEHDKEILIDEMQYRIPGAFHLGDDQVFRHTLLKLLERIAKALEKPIQVRFQY